MINARFGHCQPRAAALAAVLLCSALSIAPARAQGYECEKLKAQFETFATLMQQAQTLARKKAHPDDACRALSSLLTAQTKLIPTLEKDGAWCHVPDQTIAGVKRQGEPIAKAKTDACGAAVKLKQMEADAKKQQQDRLLGGADSIVGGPVKMPQGAL